MVQILVLQPLVPISLLDDLRAQYGADNVDYAPARPFQPPTENCVLPTTSQLARAEVILGFVIPSNLKSFKQTPKLRLWQVSYLAGLWTADGEQQSLQLTARLQGLSAGYGHLTSTGFFRDINAESEVMFASASGLHV